MLQQISIIQKLTLEIEVWTIFTAMQIFHHIKDNKIHIILGNLKMMMSPLHLSRLGEHLIHQEAKLSLANPLQCKI